MPLSNMYARLKQGQIRIFQVLPGEPGSQLYGTLIPTDLLSKGCGKSAGLPKHAYEAISYVWGDAVYEKCIFLDDGQRFAITDSLHDALQGFRLKDGPRNLWADAVCINQADDEERASQVAIMLEVYRSATRVLVWLSPSEKDDADILAFATMGAYSEIPGANEDDFETDMEDVLSAVQVNLTRDQRCRCCSKPFAQAQLLGSGLDLATLGLISVALLLNHSWFSRMWVIQEVASVQNRGDDVIVYSGKHKCPWRIFWLCLVDFKQLFDSRSIEMSAIGVSSIREYQPNIQAIDSLEQMTAFPLAALRTDVALTAPIWLSERRCSRDHDRIYALHGILRLDELTNFAISYSEPAAETFHRFTIACLTSEKCAASPSRRRRAIATYLAMQGTEKSPMLGRTSTPWPTWIPHLHYLTKRSRSKYSLYMQDRYDGIAQWFPNYTLLHYQHCETQPALLKVKGRKFGIVGEVLPDSQWPRPFIVSNVEHHEPRLTAWYHRCREFLRPHISSDDLDLDMTFVLTCRLPRLELGSERQNAVQVLGKQLREQTTFDVEWSKLDDFFLGGFLSFVAGRDAVGDVLDRGRHLAVFDIDGDVDVGWIPSNARQGDLVCAFAGLPYPFVLREAENGAFYLIGDAWSMNITLKQALSGHHNCEDPLDCRGQSRAACCDWASRDGTMQSLIEDLEWIVLA